MLLFVSLNQMKYIEGWIIDISSVAKMQYIICSIVCTKSLLQHLMLPMVLKGSVLILLYFLWLSVPPYQLAATNVGGNTAIQ